MFRQEQSPRRRLARALHGGAIAAGAAVLHRRSSELRAPGVRCQLWAFSGADAGADLAGTSNCSRSPVRITIIALQTRFCPIENPVVSVSYLFYT